MIPDFPRIYNAIEYTLEYFKIGRIKDHFYKFQGRPNLDYLDNYLAIVKRSHSYMKDEIIQNVVGSKEPVIREMLDYLNLVVSDWRFQPTIEDSISLIVIEENDKIIAQYEKDIELEEDNFRKKVDFSKPHEPPTKETEYDVQVVDGKTKINIIEPNSWFYANQRKTNLLEAIYFPKYMKIVKDILASFREVVDPYLDRYNNGRFELVGLSGVDENASKKLTAPPELRSKIEVDLTVDQLLYLFRALKEIGLIKSNNADMSRAISAAFKVLKVEDTKDLSVKHLQNKWNKLQGKPAGFWKDKFIDLHNQSKKDNPNNIK